MKYDVSHMRNPGTSASFRMLNYVGQGGSATVIDSRGMEVDEMGMKKFAAATKQADSSALHTFSFAEDNDAEMLLGAARETLPDHLDGRYLIGVHEDTDHNHLHIAEHGSEKELDFPAGSVTALGSDLADATGSEYEA